MRTSAYTVNLIARGVAYVVNPLVLPPLLFGAVLSLYGAPGREIASVALGAVLFVTVAPALLLGWMVHAGRVESVEVAERDARSLPYAAGFAGSLGALAVLFVLVQTARPLMIAVACLLCLNTALLALINTRWKISLHAAGAAGFASVLAFAAALAPATSPVAVPVSAALLVPVVMWSRMRTRAHSSGEVWAGALFGIAVPLLELAVLHAGGHL